MSGIVLRDVTKHLKILNRRERFFGALRDLFSRDYKTVKAV